MRVRIVGRQTRQLASKARAAGLTVSDANPDVIICHGGDGTLLGAERDFPGVPKLALRIDEECNKCERHVSQRVLEELAVGLLHGSKIVKLSAETGGRRLVGINDIVIHNANVFSGVRYKVWIGGELYSDEIVGDGLVAATPFGSSAYYHSITGGIIRSGIGLAFNNSTEPIDHIVLHEDEIVRVLITRGPAVLGADNNPDHIDLSEGGEVEIRKAPESATVLAIDALLCNHCSRLNGRKWSRHGGLLTV